MLKFCKITFYILRASILLFVLSSSKNLLAMDASGKQIRRSSGVRQLVPKAVPHQTDDDYAKFLRETPGFEYLANREDILQKVPPKVALQEILKEGICLKAGYNSESELPQGLYADFPLSAFAERSTLINREAKPSQGWKIHICAQPHSAQKMAALVLPVLNKAMAINKSGEKKQCLYKIIRLIPSMRTLYYILGNLQGDGRETQAGKFITIYPYSKYHAIKLLKALDNILLFARRGGILNEADAYPLNNEAKIGESGFLYVRYGNFSSPFDRLHPKIYVPAAKIERVLPKKKARDSTKQLQRQAACLPCVTSS